MLDISDIRIIKVITEVGSINRAAEILHMSQPTLSKKISRLEQKINLELFVRNSAGMVPTEAAKVLVSEGLNIEAQLSNVERHLELMANMEGGQVRIGVGPIVEQLILPKVLLDFAENNYQFRLSFTTESPEKLIRLLKTSQIDLAIGPFKSQEITEEFTTTLQMSEKLIAIVRKGHPLSAQSSMTLEQAKDYRFITPHMPRQMGCEIQQLKQTGNIDPFILCDNYAMAKTVVENSDYVTIGPGSLFRKELESGELVKLEFPSEILWLCSGLAKPETLMIPKVKEIVQLFSQYMNTMNTD